MHAKASFNHACIFATRAKYELPSLFGGGGGAPSLSRESFRCGWVLFSESRAVQRSFLLIARVAGSGFSQGGTLWDRELN